MHAIHVAAMAVGEAGDVEQRVVSDAVAEQRARRGRGHLQLAPNLQCTYVGKHTQSSRGKVYFKARPGIHPKQNKHSERTLINTRQ